MRLVSPLRPTPKQLEFLRWEPVERRDAPTVAAVVGSQGSGKSAAAALRALKVAVLCPWDPRYGQRRPMTLVLGPSLASLREGLGMALRQVVPPEFIASSKAGAEPEWVLVNGHRFVFRSYKSNWIGMTCAALIADEYQSISGQEGLWLEMMSRVRDPLAPRKEIIASGYAHSGWVRSRLDPDLQPEHVRGMHACVNMGIADNPHLPRDQADAILARSPGEHVETILRGAWTTSLDAFFPSFDSSRHLVTDPWIAAHKPGTVHVGLDAGYGHAAAVLAQEVEVPDAKGRPQRGLVVIDQVTNVRGSMTDLWHAISQVPTYRRMGAETVAYCDPTLRGDELDACRTALARFGGTLESKPRTDELYERAPGWRVVQSCLRNGLDETRLYVRKPLARAGRGGIVDGIERARRRESTGDMVKDDSIDHLLDALRYVVQGRLADLSGGYFAPILG